MVLKYPKMHFLLELRLDPARGPYDAPQTHYSPLEKGTHPILHHRLGLGALPPNIFSGPAPASPSVAEW